MAEDVCGLHLSCTQTAGLHLLRLTSCLPHSGASAVSPEEKIWERLKLAATKDEDGNLHFAKKASLNLSIRKHSCTQQLLCASLCSTVLLYLIS